MDVPPKTPEITTAFEAKMLVSPVLMVYEYGPSTLGCLKELELSILLTNQVERKLKPMCYPVYLRLQVLSILKYLYLQ